MDRFLCRGGIQQSLEVQVDWSREAIERHRPRSILRREGRLSANPVEILLCDFNRVFSEPTSEQAGKGDQELGWQDTLEKMTPEQMGTFTREFASQLADKLAKIIAAKIDEEKLLNLLKREIIQHLEKK